MRVELRTMTRFRNCIMGAGLHGAAFRRTERRVRVRGLGSATQSVRLRHVRHGDDERAGGRSSDVSGGPVHQTRDRSRRTRIFWRTVRSVATPYALDWGWGSTHTLGAITPQQDKDGAWWAFSSWSDGGAATHSYKVASTSGVGDGDRHLRPRRGDAGGSLFRRVWR